MTMPVEPPIKSPSKPVDNLDRFRPEMPQIPGVSDARPSPSTITNDTNTRRALQIGGLAAAALLAVILILWWMKSASHRASESASLDRATDASASPPAAFAPEAPATEGPVLAATVEELAKPWAAKKFTFVRPFTHENLDAMVIRLPGGGLWAFALREAYGRCDLEFVTDLDQLSKQYGYRASHPMVASPCTSTIYDPLKVGPLGGNVWARGEIVQGGSLRPPISIDVQEQGRSVIADRIE
jgi:hypothetical protein